MSVQFTDSRTFPSELRHMEGYGGAYGDYGDYGDYGLSAGAPNMNTESAIADIFRSLTTGAVDFFGGSSSAAKQAAAEAAAAQAAAAREQMYEEGQTKRTLIYVGAGLAGIFLLVSILKPSTKVKVGRYHRRTRRSRR